jgi:Tol biopolymer transport system component
MRSWRIAVLLGMLSCLQVPAAAHAAFPGKNGKIAFERANDVWTVNPDGSGQVDITNTATAAESAPSWSADGTRIAYVRDRAIWVMNADGSGQREVVAVPDETTACGSGSSLLSNGLGAPAWSPDGSKIVFHDFRACRFDADTEFQDSDLYTVNPDGTGQALLKQGGQGPRWSPDGTKIGHTQVCGGGGCTHVEWITPDRSQDFAVYLTNVDAEFFIDWSPDGSLMDGCGEGGLGHPFFYCFTIHPDGSAYTEFPRRVSPGRWSPDGTKFLLSGVYTENLDGTGLMKIADGGAADWQPIPGPQRSDYKNAAKFCKAERAFLGDAAFQQKYGGANAYGKCVSGS